MAHRARDEGEAPAGLARLGVLYPLKANETNESGTFTPPTLFAHDDTTSYGPVKRF